MYTKEKETFFEVTDLISKFQDTWGFCPNALCMSYEKHIQLLHLALVHESDWYTAWKDKEGLIRMYFMGLEIEIAEGLTQVKTKEVG